MSGAGGLEGGGGRGCGCGGGGGGVIQRYIFPRFLREVESYDVASDIRQTLTSGVATGVTQVAARYMEGDPNDPEAAAAASPQEIVNNVLDRVLDTRNWGLVSMIISSTTRQTLEAVIDVMKEQYAAGGLLRTSTRPTLNQRTEPACLYELSRLSYVMLRSRSSACSQ